MKKVLILLLSLIISNVSAQVAVKKSSVSTGGGSTSNGNISVRYSIGETAVNEAQQGQKAVSEGFIGPDLISTLGISDYTRLDGVIVYPNPVKDKLFFNFPENNNYHINLYDINGKLLLYTENDNAQHYQYNLSSFKTGVYLLVIIDRKNQQYKSLKIQKL